MHKDHANQQGLNRLNCKIDDNILSLCQVPHQHLYSAKFVVQKQYINRKTSMESDVWRRLFGIFVFFTIVQKWTLLSATCC